MQYLKMISMLLLIFLSYSPTVSAQIWKSTEQKQAINRKADAQKRIINNENTLKYTRDADLQEIYKDRLALLKTVEPDIEQWNAKINANDKINSQRYNLLTQLKLRKVEAMQMLITLRTMEIGYENFGGDFKDESIGILKQLRLKTEQSIQAFEASINEVKGNLP